MSQKRFSVMNPAAAQKALGLDFAIIVQLVKDFLEQKEAFLGPIRSSLDTPFSGALGEHAHKLKGAAYNLRIDPIGERAQELEEAAASEDRKRSRELVESLDTQFALLAEDLALEDGGDSP